MNELRALNVRPHVAQNLTRRRGGSAIDGRTTRHRGYAASQRIRKRIEEGFGWMKTVAGLDRPMLRGVERVGWAFTFAAAAYNPVRLPKLLEERRDGAPPGLRQGSILKLDNQGAQRDCAGVNKSKQSRPVLESVSSKELVKKLIKLEPLPVGAVTIKLQEHVYPFRTQHMMHFTNQQREILVAIGNTKPAAVDKAGEPAALDKDVREGGISVGDHQIFLRWPVPQQLFEQVGRALTKVALVEIILVD